MYGSRPDGPHAGKAHGMHSRCFVNTLAVVIILLALLLALLLDGLRGQTPEVPHIASEPLGWIVIQPDLAR